MADIEANVDIGQSLCGGFSGGDAGYLSISVAPPEVSNAHTLNPDGSYSDLVIASTSARQRPDLSMGYRLGAAFPSQFWGMLTCAVGGQTIAKLSKGGSSGNYETSITDLTAAKAAAVTAGKSFHVAALHWIQGESDQAIKTSASNYLLALDQLIADYKTDLGTSDWPFIMSQTATWDSYNGSALIGLAQLEAARTRPGVYVVGGQYQLPYGAPQPSNPHMQGIGYYYLGELHARAQIAIKNGQSWLPFAPSAINVDGSTLVVAFDVPTPPLQFDTTLVAERPNMGFSLVNTASQIVGVDITGPSEVTVTLDRPVTENTAELGYGVNTNPRSRLGNLHDSDPSVSAHDGYALPNWCCQFSDPIPTDTPPSRFGVLYKLRRRYVAIDGVWRRLYPANPTAGPAFGDSDFGDSRFY